MEAEASLALPQKPVTCLQPEADLSSWCPLSFLKMFYNIILLPSLGFPSGFLSSALSTKALCASPLFPVRVTCPVQVVRLDFITHIILCYEYKSVFFITQHSSLPPYLASLRLKYLPPYPIHIHSQPCSSFSWRDQISHPHKKQTKHISLYFNLYIFLEG